MVLLQIKVVLKSELWESGAQCVIMGGILKPPMSFVECLDIKGPLKPTNFNKDNHHNLYRSAMYHALDARGLSKIADIQSGIHITAAATLMMLELFVQQVIEISSYVYIFTLRTVTEYL
jgi:hypothetical protein